jgi:hypothetical protein
MRMRNIWFDLPSFVIAVVLLAGSTARIIDLAGRKPLSEMDLLASIGIGVLLGGGLLGLSFKLGDTQRRRHLLKLKEQQTRKSQEEDTRGRG